MSNENKVVAEVGVNDVNLEEKLEPKLIELSVMDYERQIDIERAYLTHDGMNPEKARKKAEDVVRKKYCKVNQSIDYSNWAGQRNE